MIKYGIPSQLVHGFRQIINLSEDEIKALSESLKNAKRGEGAKETSNSIAIHFRNLNKEQVEDLTVALFSIANTFYSTEDSLENFIEDFSTSVKVIFENSNEDDLNKFKSNIRILIPAFDPSVKKTIKAKDLLTENSKNFIESRIITDIRIVYDDDNSFEKIEQEAVIVHNLKIEYYSIFNRRNEFYVSLDMKDLCALQEVIGRAINKDKSIRISNHKLTFIDLNK